MKKFNTKILIIALAIPLATFLSCEKEDEYLLLDEDNSSSTEEIVEKTNQAAWRRAPNPDNNGGISDAIDDRSRYNYFNSGSYGVYRLTSGDNNGGLQTRIERSTSAVDYSNGASVTVWGTAKIEKAGIYDESRSVYANNDVRDRNGTYFAQVKGKHSGASDSDDPALVLFIAKPKRENRYDYGRNRWISGGGKVKRKNGKVEKYEIWAEILNKRGSDSDRRMEKITEVSPGQDFYCYITTTFLSNNRQKIQYWMGSGYGINFMSTRDKNNSYTTPINTKIRMGAYRCKGGTAKISWKNDLGTNRYYGRY